MRKVHYRVVLDVLVYEDEGTDVVESLKDSDFYPCVVRDDVDIQDVIVESVDVIDSH